MVWEILGSGVLENIQCPALRKKNSRFAVFVSFFDINIPTMADLELFI